MKKFSYFHVLSLYVYVCEGLECWASSMLGKSSTTESTPVLQYSNNLPELKLWIRRYFKNKKIAVLCSSCLGFFLYLFGF